MRTPETGLIARAKMAAAERDWPEPPTERLDPLARQRAQVVRGGASSRDRGLLRFEHDQQPSYGSAPGKLDFGGQIS